jgi:VWFA-related protein
MRVRPTGLIAIQVVAAATLIARGQPDKPAQFRSGVELIQLDVAVLDDKRVPVRGLTANDFTVLDNGTPASIRAFTAVELAASARANDPVWAQDVAPDVATNAIGEEEGRLVVILMDRSIPVVDDALVNARKIATAAVDALGPHDLGAVVSTVSHAVQDGRVQNVTADRARLLRAINYGDPTSGMSPEAMGVMNMPPAPFKVDPMNETTCFCGVCVPETITRVAEAVQATPRRRKLLLFIGSNMFWQANRPAADAKQDPGCEVRLKDARTAMFAAIDRANLTVHSIDPQGLVNVGPQARASGVNRSPSSALDALQTGIGSSLSDRANLTVLPDRTGGRTVVGRNQPEQVVPDIFRESEAYYVLGIERGTSNRADGTRAIDVKVARKGLRVVAQRRYAGLPASATAASTPSLATGASPSARDALSRLLPSARVPLALAVTTFASADSAKAMVRVNIDAAGFAPPDATAVPLDVAVHAVDRVGRSVASATQSSTITAARAAGRFTEVNIPSHLELPPGDYEIRAALTEPASGRVASVFANLTIPKFDDDPLSLSDISVETASGQAGDSSPTTRRAFRVSDKVRAVVQIYQGTRRTEALMPVSMRVQILDAKGKAIRDQSLPFDVPAFANRRADCVITLPLASLPSGEYLLKLDALKDQKTVRRAVRFTVER